MVIIKSSIKSIAIGGFDGMHIAHGQLFSRLCKDGGIVVIQTSYANLSPKTYRSEHTHLPIFYYPLENIKKLSGEEFISLICEEFPSLEKIVVGYDFHFGYQASCSTKELNRLFKGEVIVVDEYKVEGVSVHSRVIREFLREGDIQKANSFLGYEYTVEGIHVKGQGLGKKQFVPTINLDIEDFLVPKEGIYITQTYVNNRYIPSVTFIGHRLSTDGKYAVETHLLEDFDIEHCSKSIKVKFYGKLRDNKKYELHEELKKQILEDIEDAKEFFKTI